MTERGAPAEQGRRAPTQTPLRRGARRHAARAAPPPSRVRPSSLSAPLPAARRRGHGCCAGGIGMQRAVPRRACPTRPTSSKRFLRGSREGWGEFARVKRVCRPRLNSSGSICFIVHESICAAPARPAQPGAPRRQHGGQRQLNGESGCNGRAPPRGAGAWRAGAAGAGACLHDPVTSPENPDRRPRVLDAVD